MNRKEAIRTIAGLAMGGMLVRPRQVMAEISEQVELQFFLNSIRPEYNNWRNVITKNDIFGGFKIIPRDLQLASFDMYYPMYKAGEEKYKIDWKWAFIFHAFETGFSTAPNPRASGFFGPLQTSFNQQEIDNAINGWTMLRKLPQRYTLENVGFYDCDGIMDGMGRMRSYVDEMRVREPNSPQFEIEKLALRWYCGDDYTKTSFAEQRLELVHRMNRILQADTMGKTLVDGINQPSQMP